MSMNTEYQPVLDVLSQGWFGVYSRQLTSFEPVWRIYEQFLRIYTCQLMLSYYLFE